MVGLMVPFLVLPLVTSIATDKVGQSSYFRNNEFRRHLWMVIGGVVEHVTSHALVKPVRE